MGQALGIARGIEFGLPVNSKWRLSTQRSAGLSGIGSTFQSRFLRVP